MTIFRVKLLGTNYLIDSTKAEEKLGYQSHYDLEKTIQDSIESYLKSQVRNQRNSDSSPNPF
jgi:nucleoside-diphosphate-sugar epimerase